MKKKSQVWSLDTIIASVIFITTIVIFIAILYRPDPHLTHEELIEESNRLNQVISGSEQGRTQTTNLAFLIGTNIDIERTINVKERSYNELKNAIGLRADFCIYIEDMEGNIINLSKYTKEELKMIGIGHNGTIFKDDDGKVMYCSN